METYTMETELHRAILRTLSYFQVFQYPLKKHEIWKFLTVKCSIEDFEEALSELEVIDMVYNINNYYCLVNDINLIEDRKEGNILGAKKLKKAMRISRFLGMFPFVEAVCISGSLSKDFAQADSDLDYFIITAPNRLWIARNVMHFFRKLTFVVNAQSSFCMNYYVSLNKPEISPKNFYTAIELATLKTTFCCRGMKELINENKEWVSEYLPNAGYSDTFTGDANDKWRISKVIEFLINKIGGDAIESFFYVTTMGRWAKKWSKKRYPLGKCMRSAGPHFNTPLNYPENLPENILRKYGDIFRQTELKYNVVINNLAPTIPALH